MSTLLTPLETELLTAIRDDDYHDGRGPVGSAVWSHYLNVSMPARRVPGVMASLAKKGYVTCAGSGRDATVTYLQAGDDALRADSATPVATGEKAPAPTVERQREMLANALRRTRELYPTARELHLTTSDQDTFGFVVKDVFIAGPDGIVSVDGARPEYILDLQDALFSDLCDLEWNSVVGEDAHGFAMIAIS